MSSMVASRRPTPGRGAPQAGLAVTNPAARADQRYRTVQLALFAAGAVLMPVGLIAILIGWYGTAHSHYTYDQNTYLISGGVLGLGLIFLGGFLYFGAWLAKVAHDQRESAQQLADTILVLADLVSRSPGAGVAAAGGAAEPVQTLVDHGAVPVLAGQGTTIHRRDCALIAHREDLRVLTTADPSLGTCRVCRPDLG